MGREGLTDKITLEKDLKEVRSDPCEFVGKQSWQQEEPVQRPCGQSVSGMFLGPFGGLCGWSRGSKGESTRRGGESRGGKSRRLLWESLGDSRFTPVSWKARVDAEQWRK